MAVNNEFLTEFLEETAEGLTRLDRDLVLLEQNPDDPTLIDRLFRTLHTIKGSAGFMGLPLVESVAHAGEGLLSRLRDNKITMSADITNVLLAAVDALREITASLQANGTEGRKTYANLISELRLLAGGGGEQLSHLSESRPRPGTEAISAAPLEQRADQAPVERRPPADTRSDRAADMTMSWTEYYDRNPAPPADDGFDLRPASEDATFASPAGPVGRTKQEPTSPSAPREMPTPSQPITPPPSSARPSSPPMPAPPSRAPVPQSPNGKPTSAEPRSAAPAEQPEPAEPTPAASGRPAREGDSSSASSSSHPRPSEITSQSTIRVSVEVLDELMNLTGELVLTRNQIVQTIGRRVDPALQAMAHRLDRVTAQLQVGMLKTRMQPVDAVFQKLPRVVRDLARQCGRKVRLVVTGGDTELDKSLLEAIHDPLIHLVRNAVDHGIEPPIVRREKGKPEEGRIELRAYHAAGQVHIEVIDDGVGLNTQRIRERLVERGLASRDDVSTMSDKETLDSVFLPGFSTAQTVSRISGRGVGMDVVKSQVEGVGGAVTIESELGKGTLVRLSMPLTLAIMPALIVSIGDARYAIPQVHLVELLDVRDPAADPRIERIVDVYVLRLREELIPLVDARRFLLGEPCRGPAYIAVLRVGASRFGLLVDAVNDTQEIVLKALPAVLDDVPVYAGATIMSDGTVALILDVGGLSKVAATIYHRDQDGEAAALDDEQDRDADDLVLLCESRRGVRIAIPVSAIVRIEQVNPASIEPTFGGEVMHFDGRLIPLFHLAGDHSRSPDEHCFVIVIRRLDDSVVGILVREVFDIESAPRGRKVGGPVVLNGVATEILDLTDLAGRGVRG